MYNQGKTGINMTGGIVEVYQDNKWGTVCSSRTSPSVATTVCRQLGYYDGTIVSNTTKLVLKQHQ